MSNPFKKFRRDGEPEEAEVVRERPRRSRPRSPESKTKLGLGIVTAIIILVIVSQSVVIVEAGHRGVLYTLVPLQIEYFLKASLS